MFAVDQVEALIELGRWDDAVGLLDWYEANARRLGRASALAQHAAVEGFSRGRGVSMTRSRRLAEALELHAEVDLPSIPEGQACSRSGLPSGGRSAAAKADGQHGQAVELFDRLGARCGRALSCRDRSGQRTGARGRFASAGRRSASPPSVAQGRTGREGAAALFLSERTVEGHLSRVYGKARCQSRRSWRGCSRLIARSDRSSMGIPPVLPKPRPLASNAGDRGGRPEGKEER